MVTPFVSARAREYCTVSSVREIRYPSVSPNSENAYFGYLPCTFTGGFSVTFSSPQSPCSQTNDTSPNVPRQTIVLWEFPNINLRGGFAARQRVVSAPDSEVGHFHGDAQARVLEHLDDHTHDCTWLGRDGYPGAQPLIRIKDAIIRHAGGNKGQIGCSAFSLLTSIFNPPIISPPVREIKVRKSVRSLCRSSV